MYLNKQTKLLSLLLVTVLSACTSTHNAPVEDYTQTYPPHIVERGETLSLIARKYNTSVEELARLNNIQDISRIFPGQVLRISAKSNIQKTNNSSSSSAVTTTASGKATDAGLISWAKPTAGQIIKGYDDASRGIDYSGSVGDPVLAAASGTVSYTGNGIRGLGNLILITHKKPFISAYAHTDKILVKEGQKVIKGQQIATLGSSDTPSPKLHFEIRRDGKPVNPASYLP
ncbi:LysM peptidoglycan-binding domain-containing M23 family metallopeptidase [Taylorella equigenitalis]|uniref:LysM peptidoglycan-binding domain-containing M23 family metallopeptidase n=1 Tax=Taylorella equigenitalis TaxID=29575 RepID=UPI00040FA829|nr:peptidoglycan DD-metalloendopeptidase family protein [Taylorella equigenitalis]ASY40940.1 peptidase [Taylorella equigenitalis]